MRYIDPTQSTQHSTHHKKTLSVPLLLLCMITCTVCIAALSCGAISISTDHLWRIASHTLTSTQLIPSDALMAHVLAHIRLPRVLMAAFIGAGLALSGATLQGIFRNPLADPGLIGVSSGAALGVVSFIVWGAGAHLNFGAPIAAFTGGLAVTFAVMALAKKQGQIHIATMLLAGIAINSMCGALIGFITYISDEAQLRSWTMWSLGSLGGASWTQVAIVAPITILGAVVLMRQAHHMDLFILGTREANHLGVDVAKVRWTSIVWSALIVGVGVGFTGMIGFVGLVVPHLLRLWKGPSHRWTLPASCLLGASLLIIADTLARTVAAPAELPIGVLTALLGAPFFLWLLWRSEHTTGGW